MQAQSNVQAERHLETELLAARKRARARAKAEARSKMQAQESYDAEAWKQNFRRVHLASAKKATEDAVRAAADDLREEEKGLDASEYNLTYHKKNRTSYFSLSFTESQTPPISTSKQTHDENLSYVTSSLTSLTSEIRENTGKESVSAPGTRNPSPR